MKRVLVRLGMGLVVSGVGLVLALCVAGALYTPNLTIPAGLLGKHVEVDGLSLRVLTEGKGRDLLMIHGSSGSLEDYALQAEALSGSYRVTRYDRPGHGYSGDGGEYSLAYNARVALALIEKLKLERVVVVGHSYGGSTALALALLHSPRVAAYVVIDSAVYKHVRPLNPIYQYTGLPLFGPGLLRVLRGAVQKKVAEGLRAEFVSGPPPAGFLELRSQIWSQPKVGHALARESLDSGRELVRQSAHYPEIKAPVYFVAQKDTPGRVENATHFKRDVPQTVLELTSNTGHMIQFEQPDVVTQLIQRAAREH
jgi:pimeloyl-ACP methyl ester carboxylesterase